MSHQSGIQACQELHNLFTKCKTNDTRILVVRIVDEQLKECRVFPKTKNWQQDYASILPKLLLSDDPCYILVRLDSANALGSDWLFITFVPDSAPVRQRMLYASTRATLKSEFGSVHIKYDIQASAKSDLTPENLRNSCENKSTVLSFVEYDLMQAKIEESNPACQGSMMANQTLKGISFPVDQEAMEKLRSLANGEINYVQLAVDTLNEAIKLEHAGQVSATELHTYVPRSKPRYHFYAYEHDINSDSQEQQRPQRSVLFLYTIPPSVVCSIKDRMLYSCCKNPFLYAVEVNAGLKLDRKIEVDSAETIDEDFLLYQLQLKHKGEDQANGSQKTFSKPQGPKNQRGNRRITKVEG